jgi:uncharacterized protein
MNLWVDADACPVKFEVLEVAKRFDLKPIFVSHQNIKSLKEHSRAEFVLCESGPDSADDHIVEKLEKGDLLVSADLLLSKRALEQEGWVINFFGKEVTRNSVGTDLGRKDVHSLADELGIRHRESGGKPAKGNFKGALHNLLDRLIRS